MGRLLSKQECEASNAFNKRFLKGIKHIKLTEKLVKHIETNKGYSDDPAVNHVTWLVYTTQNYLVTRTSTSNCVNVSRKRVRYCWPNSFLKQYHTFYNLIMIFV